MHPPHRRLVLPEDFLGLSIGSSGHFDRLFQKCEPELPARPVSEAAGVLASTRSLSPQLSGALDRLRGQEGVRFAR